MNAFSLVIALGNFHDRYYFAIIVIYIIIYVIYNGFYDILLKA